MMTGHRVVKLWVFTFLRHFNSKGSYFSCHLHTLFVLQCCNTTFIPYNDAIVTIYEVYIQYDIRDRYVIGRPDYHYCKLKHYTIKAETIVVMQGTLRCVLTHNLHQSGCPSKFRSDHSVTMQSHLQPTVSMLNPKVHNSTITK